jgi:AAA15 family ATPase/GTPase
MSRIEEASQILKDLGLTHISQQISALTLLALCDIKPEDEWKDAKRKSATLSNGIMEFARVYYNVDYKPNTRESFRKLALKPFLDIGIAELNPDNPNLSPTSSRTHYAVTPFALNIIQKYGSSEWKIAAENFKEASEQYTGETREKFFLERVIIKNFKSIVDTTIDLGRINVFIGANGSGKTNILEALAFVGAFRGDDLNLDGLYSRGVRIARPNLIISSFLDTEQKASVEVELKLKVNEEHQSYETELVPFNSNNIYSKWYDLKRKGDSYETILSQLIKAVENNPSLSAEDLLKSINTISTGASAETRKSFDNWLSEYAIFDVNTKTLRGITPPDSRKTPLGLNGEWLDSIISNFKKDTRDRLLKTQYFDWLDNIIAESENDDDGYVGLKANKSTSNLYFTDKYMNASNKTLSAENSNEGILHVLFYLSLFISHRTPKLFGIDNIETALNPRLCRFLIKELADLSKQYDKQALITTHNPAILDGLNLLDDEQRLFEVFRNDEGHTEVRRIKFKSDLSDKSGKLSQMWLSGQLGATPKNF